MERRFFLALLLTGAVIVLTPQLFPTPPRPATTVADSLRADSLRADSAARAGAARAGSPAATTAAPIATAPAATPATTQSEATFRGSPPVPTPPLPTPVGPDTLTISVAAVEYRFDARAPALISARLNNYRSHRPDRGAVQLRDPDGALIDYALAIGGDTIALSSGTWRAELGDRTVRYTGTVGVASVELTYLAVPDSYVVHASGRVTAPSRATLLVRLPSGFISQETDTLDDFRSLSFAAKPVRRDAKRIGFGSLDPGEEDTIPGPLQWAVAKTKYFMVAILAPADTTPSMRETGGEPFGSLMITGGRKTSSIETEAIGVLSHPVTTGAFAFEIYTGPQEWRRLHRMGRDLENANPYGGFMQGIVQPFATIVMRALLWMKETTRLSYGWVLVLFGILIRVAIWPLQQSAMRTSIKMQRLHPEIQEVQKRYGKDQQKMQAELMRVYREHGMTPLSPLAGCLPMLLPMPVLFALFFVFQNTIEFRGVPFLWLPDISLKDPYYIIPITMGISMFVLSWIGMRGVPPNPQTKMMAYVMPIMMTVVFLNFASGLNLYYTVQNLVGLPQQWLIARERTKRSADGGRGGTGGGGSGTKRPG